MNALSETQVYNLQQRGLKLKHNIEVHFLELGKIFHILKETGDKEVFDLFCMEMKMDSTVVSKLMKIYRVFVLRFEVEPKLLADAGGWSILAEYTPLIVAETPRTQVLEWIGECTQLTRQAVRQTLRERKTGISMADCKHKDTYEITICRDCGIKMQDK